MLPRAYLSMARSIARVHETPAQDAGQRLPDLRRRRLGILIEKCLRGQDHAVEAEAALRRLFVDKRLLNRVRLFGRAQTLERRDARAADGRDGCHARADRAAADNRGARAALAEAAAELRTAQTEVIAEHIEERRCRIDVDGATLPVHGERNAAHMWQTLSRTNRYIAPRSTPADWDESCRYLNTVANSAATNLKRSCSRSIRNPRAQSAIPRTWRSSSPDSR